MLIYIVLLAVIDIFTASMAFLIGYISKKASNIDARFKFVFFGFTIFGIGILIESSILSMSISMYVCGISSVVDIFSYKYICLWHISSFLIVMGYSFILLFFSGRKYLIVLPYLVKVINEIIAFAIGIIISFNAYKVNKRSSIAYLSLAISHLSIAYGCYSYDYLLFGIGAILRAISLLMLFIAILRV